jgi:hypothetical protein
VRIRAVEPAWTATLCWTGSSRTVPTVRPAILTPRCQEVLERRAHVAPSWPMGRPGQTLIDKPADHGPLTTSKGVQRDAHQRDSMDMIGQMCRELRKPSRCRDGGI